MLKWSFSYEVLRFIIHYNFISFYNTISCKGIKNIPKKKPMIFAANHQNALMDPLGILFTSKQQAVFLTRADIFNNPLLLKIFTFLKMLPVFRIRDGKDALKNNERIFNKSVEILEANMSIALFPEATHTDKRRLRPTKKAVPRIAFQAEAKNNFLLDLQIVPVGIYYDNYLQSNSNLFINYGKPFGISEFKNLFEENPQKAYMALKEKLEKAIIPLIIHQPDMDNYELYENLRIFSRPLMREKLSLKKNNPSNNFIADKKTIKKIYKYYSKEENDINEIRIAFSEYNNQCKKHDIPNKNKKEISSLNLISSFILYILGFPIFLFGVLNNIVYYEFIKSFLNKKVKDLQFYTSIKFALSIAITYIIYPLHAAILWAISGMWTWALAYLIALPLTALFANKYRYRWKYYMEDIALWKFIRSSKSSDYKESKKKLEDLLLTIFNEE